MEVGCERGDEGRIEAQQIFGTLDGEGIDRPRTEVGAKGANEGRGAHHITEAESWYGVLLGHGVKLQDVAHADGGLGGEHGSEGVVFVGLVEDKESVLGGKCFDM